MGHAQTFATSGWRRNGSSVTLAPKKRRWFTASGNTRDRKQWRVGNNRDNYMTHSEQERAYRTVHAFVFMRRAVNVMQNILFHIATKVLPHGTIVVICVRCLTIMCNRKRGSRRATPAPLPPRHWLGERREETCMTATVFLSPKLHPQLQPTWFRLVEHIRNKRCRVNVRGKKGMQVQTCLQTVSPPLKSVSTSYAIAACFLTWMTFAGHWELTAS